MSHLSTLTLHRLRYGELAGPPLQAARGHLDHCPQCAARLRVQEQERAQFVLRPVPPEIRALGAVPSRWRLWLAVPALLAAMAALALALPMLQETTDNPQPDIVRFRGTLPEVEAWIDVGTGPRPLRAEDVLGEGDRVQLKYDPHGASYVALAGRDRTGVIEVYSTEAPTGIGLVNAPFALTLDNTPGAQELFVVGSDEPLHEAQVKEAILHGVEGARVSQVTLVKETPR